jgi:hypothetical protein
MILPVTQTAMKRVSNPDKLADCSILLILEDFAYWICVSIVDQIARYIDVMKQTVLAYLRRGTSKQASLSAMLKKWHAPMNR